jgi:hypothetical protein
MTVDPDRYRDQMTFLEAERTRLRQENHLLKRTIKSAIGAIEFDIPVEISLELPDEITESWSEKSHKFAGIRSQLLETALHLIKTYGIAVHHDQILRAFKNRFARTFESITNPGETIPRRLRELAEMGYLTRPQQGYYFIGPKSGRTG